MTEGDQVYVIEKVESIGTADRGLSHLRTIEGVIENMHMAEKWVNKANKSAKGSNVTYESKPVLVLA